MKFIKPKINLIFSSLIISLFLTNCQQTDVPLEGKYFGEVDKNKVLVIQKDHTYFYYYNKNKLFSGKWKYENPDLFLYDFDMSKICSLGQEDSSFIYIHKYNMNGYMKFSGDNWDCNFIHEKK